MERQQAVLEKLRAHNKQEDEKLRLILEGGKKFK
jgi:hypothetical protein